MEVITKVKEVVVVPKQDGLVIEVRKEDVIVHNDVEVGKGQKGEFIDAFELLPDQVDAVMGFAANVLGKKIDKDAEIVAINVQIVEPDMFVSIATVNPLVDENGVRLGQTAPHRTVITLSKEDQLALGNFVGKQLDAMHQDVLAHQEAELAKEEAARLEAEKKVQLEAELAKLEVQEKDVVE